MSISPIKFANPHAPQFLNTNPEELLETAILNQDWATTLDLLNNYEFEAYPPSTLMQVVHRAKREEREQLFEKFFQNDKPPFDEEEISKALLIAAADNHQDVIEILMQKPLTRELPPNVRNSVNYIPKGPNWGLALFNCARYGLISHVQLIFDNTGIFLPPDSQEISPSNAHCQALTENEMQAAYKAAVDEAEKLPENSDQRTNIEMAAIIIRNKMMINQANPEEAINTTEFCRTS